MKVDDLIGLIELLPDSWRRWALLALQVMPIVAWVLVAAKKLFVIPVPKPDDPFWRKLGLYGIVALDFLAANSEPLTKKLRESRPPPPRASIPPGGPMGLLLALPVLLFSCAATPLQTHASVADSTASLIDEAGRVLEQRIRVVEKDALDASATRDEAVARIQRLRQTYAPLEAAYEAVRLAHEAYVDAILRASAAGRERPEADVLAALSAAWVELVKRAETLGLKLPQPPPGVAKLLGGGS